MFDRKSVIRRISWPLGFMLLILAILFWLDSEEELSYAAPAQATHHEDAPAVQAANIVESCGSSSQSIQEQADPYPRSAYVSLEWAPTSTLRCAAKDSDNFVLTWMANDDIYASYGDGYGVLPKRDEKMSMGFITLTGSAVDFAGENDLDNNIDASALPDAQGRKGIKASGLISIDGVLYIWLRNVNGDGRWCQVARSEDGGHNWQKASWEFRQFGYCGFVNYGQDHAMPEAVATKHGDYVYMYTHDEESASAYYTGNGFILTRVPKDRLMERSAYEFFLERDAANNALWTSDINEVVGIDHEDRRIFIHRNKASRSSMIYNPGLDRYFWWQGYGNHSDDIDERYTGGFGIYDAPEPWGPWTTVYNVANWDWGPGDMGTFPIKWISEDGLTMYLLFSGNDRLAVRRADLTSLTTPDPTATHTQPPPPTVTPTPSLTPKPTSTVTTTPTPTVTPTPTETPTPTSTPRPEETGTPTATSTSTVTPTPTLTPSLTPTPFLDEDGDSIYSIYEGFTGASVPTTQDTDGDGFLDFLDADDDNDGIPTIFEFADPNGDGNPADALDIDGDLKPNYLDDDDDNDGIATIVEGNADRNQNGTPDYLDTSAAILIYLPFTR